MRKTVVLEKINAKEYVMHYNITERTYADHFISVQKLAAMKAGKVFLADVANIRTSSVDEKGNVIVSVWNKQELLEAPQYTDEYCYIIVRDGKAYSYDSLEYRLNQDLYPHDMRVKDLDNIYMTTKENVKVLETNYTYYSIVSIRNYNLCYKVEK